MFGEIGMIIGQGLSLVAVITGFVSFQMKTAKGILFEVSSLISAIIGIMKTRKDVAC